MPTDPTLFWSAFWFGFGSGMAVAVVLATVSCAALAWFLDTISRPVVCEHQDNVVSIRGER